MVSSKRGESLLERDLGKAGKGHTRLETFGPEEHQSVLGLEDISKIWVLYKISGEFDLELLEFDARVNNLPLGRLVVYEKAFKVGLRFFLLSFLLEFFRFYGISLCILTLNSLRVALVFLIIYFLIKIWTSF